MNKWNEFYIKWSNDLSQMSKDEKLGVGCIITTSNKKNILSIGINGAEIGGRNKRISKLTGQSGNICAEDNCLIKLNTQENNLIMYVSHKPCSLCGIRIVNSQKIKTVYYKHNYKSNSDKTLKKAGIKLRRIS